MNYFKIGCNFDPKLIDIAADLNKKYYPNSVISEFYGSERFHAYLTARPDFRLPEVSHSQFENYIKKSVDNNINFNYTMNTIYPGSKKELQSKKSEIQDFVKYLEDVGVTRITIANPILLDFIREVSNTISLEISTIAHIDAVTQIKYYKEKYNVDKICNNLMKNRSIKFLKAASKYGKNNDVAIELMVNEFCGVGGKDYATHCIYRDSCYLCHSSNITKEDAESLDGYPMKYCIFSRSVDTMNWLRMRFVRPEDIKRYNEIGINHFKVTGRTGTTEYIEKMAEAYMSGSWEGNLLELWKPLETIYSGQNELDFHHDVFIDNKKLDSFINKWFEDENFDCANEECGETCTYCHQYSKKL